MAQFTADADDLREIVHHHRNVFLKRSVPYVIGPLIAASVLLIVSPSLSLIALGMSAAWTISTLIDWRNLTAAYLWRYAWMQEPVRIELSDDGISMTNQRGSSMLRWDGGLAVRALATCFVVEEEGEDLVVLPKRYLDSSELVILNAKSSAATTSSQTTIC